VEISEGIGTIGFLVFSCILIRFFYDAVTSYGVIRHCERLKGSSIPAVSLCSPSLPEDDIMLLKPTDLLLTRGNSSLLVSKF